jgi:hypothetical protein
VSAVTTLDDHVAEKLAGRMTPVADCLARAVAAEDAARTGAILTALGTRELYALAVVLAARAPAAPSCRNCGRERRRKARRGYEGARGYCDACYSRAARAGFPETVPPPAPRGGWAVGPGTRRMTGAAGRREDYGWLRDQGCSRAEAAARVGVGRTAAREYERAYQAERGSEAA